MIITKYIALAMATLAVLAKAQNTYNSTRFNEVDLDVIRESVDGNLTIINSAGFSAEKLDDLRKKTWVNIQEKREELRRISFVEQPIAQAVEECIGKKPEEIIPFMRADGTGLVLEASCEEILSLHKELKTDIPEVKKQLQFLENQLKDLDIRFSKQSAEERIEKTKKQRKPDREQSYNEL
jgi:hypothetical protein